MPPEAETPEAETPEQQEVAAALEDFSWDDPEIAEDGAPPSPEASEQEAGDATEDAAEGTQESLAELLKGMTPEQFDALVADLPPEVKESSAFLKEVERRGEQRARTRQQEYDENLSIYQREMGEIISLGQQAERALQDTLESLPIWKLERALSDPEMVDADTAKRVVAEIKELIPVNGVRGAMAAIRAGALTQAAMNQRREIAANLRKYADLVGKLSDDEFDALEKASYEDARTGKASAHDRLLDILVDRAKKAGYEDGFQKGQKKRQTDAELLDKVKQIATVRNGTAPSVNGKPVALNEKAILQAWNEGRMSREEFDAHVKAGRVNLDFNEES